MRIVDFQLKKYDLSFIKPITIDNHTLSRRSGAIIFLADDTGLVGCGEAAPLGGLQVESLGLVIEQLNSLKGKIVGMPIHAGMLDEGFELEELLGAELAPSAGMGIEMAVFNLLRQGDEYFFNPPATAVDVSGLVMADQDTVSQVAGLLEKGYRTIKVKVGRGPVEEDVETVRTLMKLIEGRARLRLDANRSWRLGEAVYFCRRISPAPIDYIEEPLTRLADLPEFFNQTLVHVALDETVKGGQIGWAAGLPGVNTLVLKPDLLGGFSRTLRLIDLAAKLGKKACLSSTFQTSVGIEAFAAFACKAGITDVAQGLDTVKYLAEDLPVDPLVISNGAMNISRRPVPADGLRMSLLEDIDR